MDNSQIENTIIGNRTSINEMFHEARDMMQKGTPDSKTVECHISHDFTEIERKTRLQNEQLFA